MVRYQQGQRVDTMQQPEHETSRHRPYKHNSNSNLNYATASSKACNEMISMAILASGDFPPLGSQPQKSIKNSAGQSASNGSLSARPSSAWFGISHSSIHGPPSSALRVRNEVDCIVDRTSNVVSEGWTKVTIKKRAESSALSASLSRPTAVAISRRHAPLKYRPKDRDDDVDDKVNSSSSSTVNKGRHRQLLLGDLIMRKHEERCKVAMPVPYTVKQQLAAAALSADTKKGRRATKSADAIPKKRSYKAKEGGRRKKLSRLKRLIIKDRSERLATIEGEKAMIVATAAGTILGRAIDLGTVSTDAQHASLNAECDIDSDEWTDDSENVNDAEEAQRVNQPLFSPSGVGVSDEKCKREFERCGENDGKRSFFHLAKDCGAASFVPALTAPSFCSSDTLLGAAGVTGADSKYPRSPSLLLQLVDAPEFVPSFPPLAPAGDVASTVLLPATICSNQCASRGRSESCEEGAFTAPAMSTGGGGVGKAGKQGRLVHGGKSSEMETGVGEVVGQSSVAAGQGRSNQKLVREYCDQASGRQRTLFFFFSEMYTARCGYLWGSYVLFIFRQIFILYLLVHTCRRSGVGVCLNNVQCNS
mmetsp:Transcript_67530/g.180469  ORF Transcript_67530/g.180469 Transcript_67530/m.180469 type:complete len:591 (+) Transcript_67530:2-1774(+)